MKKTKLLDICRPKRWKTIAKKDLKTVGYPVYGANGIIGYYDTYNHEEPTLLITGVGATCGEINISAPKSYVTGNAISLDNLSKDCDIKYLFYALKNFDFSHGIISGSAQPQITIEGLKKVEIVMPELFEQQRIADELDRVSSIIQKQKKQLSLFDDLVKSKFNVMFGNPVQNDMMWRVDSIENVAPIVQYKGNVFPNKDGKFWLLGLDKVVPHTGEIVSYNFVDKSNIGSSTIKFSPENVLYSKLRPYLNKVVSPNECGYATSELLPFMPKKELLTTCFFACLLRSTAFMDYIQVRVAGAKMPRVSMDILKKFSVILPPMVLQQKFSNFVDTIEKTKIRIKVETEQAEMLYRSLMQKYFG